MSDNAISGHYQSGNLEQRLSAALLQDGVDPMRPTIKDLTPYDQFHGRGLEATNELTSKLEINAGDQLLDVGSGIGGPARYFADRFKCIVTGIDLTEEFCSVARELTKRVGLQDDVTFHVGNALQMPFADASFAGAYSMNVSMNIADKTGLYREIHRVLQPGGWLALSELAKGPGEEMTYPTPWAATAASSFLATPADTRSNLEECGFTIESFEDASEKVIEYGKRARRMVEQGQKPPHRAVQLIHGEGATEAMKNTSRGVAEARIVPIEVICRKI
ncbi:MAG: class I SAM-dependent methyltransferase [Pseudomonadota bacterium]